METALAIISVPLALMALLFSFYEMRKNHADIARQKKQIDQKIYETLILREVGERVGYELNIEKILQTVVSSLNKLIPYSVVSYMLLTPNPSKVLLRSHLDEPVSRDFLDNMLSPMITLLNDVTRGSFTRDNLSEELTGTILDESIKDKVASFWMTPIVLNTRGRGVIAIASRVSGLYRGEEISVLEKILAQANRAVNSLEKVLETEKSKMAAMVESMADGVVMLDNAQNLVAINPSARKYLGLGNSDVTIFDLALVLANKMDIRTKFEEAVRFSKQVEIEEVLVNDRYYQISISPVRDGQGAVIGGVILFHDTSVQKELQRMRQDFTAMIVHELRAPLTVVRGTTDMLLTNPGLSDQVGGKELLKNMAGSAESMLSLVNDLLDVAKIEAGKFSIAPSPNNLSEVILERVNFYKPLAQQKSVEISTEISDNLPILHFDRNRISQVLTNLLSNALKFTPAGGKITIGAQANQTEVTVCVADSGEGIPKEKIPELFTRFKQIKPSDKGTGLGLAIVKGIVDAHKGRVWVESEVGTGSKFYFALPLGVDT